MTQASEPLVERIRAQLGGQTFGPKASAIVALNGDQWAEIIAALEAREQIADLKCSVIAFAVPWAVHYGKQFGLPKDHLHPAHYDLLAECGARMDIFTRGALPTPATEGEA